MALVASHSCTLTLYATPNEFKNVGTPVKTNITGL